MYTCGSIRPKPYRLDTRWRKVILALAGAADSGGYIRCSCEHDELTAWSA